MMRPQARPIKVESATSPPLLTNNLVRMQKPMIASMSKNTLIAIVLVTISSAALTPASVHAWTDDRDWPMYNHDVIGTRHNPAETALNATTARQLEEKWRFPARGSNEEIGVVHATPVVVNGYVYFGTTTDPTFYKLTPDGKVRWSYRRPGIRGGAAPGNDSLPGIA